MYRHCYGQNTAFSIIVETQSKTSRYLSSPPPFYILFAAGPFETVEHLLTLKRSEVQLSRRKRKQYVHVAIKRAERKL